ncbi:MAG: transposase [Gammaproteobacteria bacterium]|nr:transposase [Gammaproteobacteria bacterium]
MNQAREKLSHTWQHIQSFLFPIIRKELGELTAKQKQLVSVLEVAKLEEHLPYAGRYPGRPPEDRIAIARAFVTKMVYNMATTRILLERLESDPTIRRLCGWERRAEVPSESTFSRAFDEFAQSRLPERVHQALIEQHLGEQMIGHISRDSTAINAREKPEKKLVPIKKNPKKRGRPKKGEERAKEPTRLERQAAGQPLSGMLADLPKACNVGTKRNSKGHTTSWIGYKLHIDAADGGIPISCILTSASLHDSQAAIPLAEITHGRVTNLYDMMDAAYDAPQIKAHSRGLGHVPIIDTNPRSKAKKEALEAETKRRRKMNYTVAEDRRYNERSTVERVNGRIKDEFGARMVRVRGNAKVMAHLMFGIVALTVDQMMKFIE